MGGVRMSVVLYCNDMEIEGIQRFMKSLKKWGWRKPFIVCNNSCYLGPLSKVVSLRSSLELLRMEGVSHVMMLDPTDSVVCREQSAVEKRLNDRIVFSAEVCCWPLGPGLSDVWSPKYPACDTKWKYLNSGGLVGPIDAVESLLSGYVPDYAKYPCDQAFYHEKFLEGGHSISIDTDCRLFQTTGHCQPDEFEVTADGHVYNRKTRTLPSVIHGNGGTDMSWVPC